MAVSIEVAVSIEARVSVGASRVSLALLRMVLQGGRYS